MCLRLETPFLAPEKDQAIKIFFIKNNVRLKVINDAYFQWLRGCSFFSLLK